MVTLVGFFTMVIIGIIIRVLVDMGFPFIAIEVTGAHGPIDVTKRVATIAKGVIAAGIIVVGICGVTGTCAATAAYDTFVAIYGV